MDEAIEQKSAPESVTEALQNVKETAGRYANEYYRCAASQKPDSIDDSELETLLGESLMKCMELFGSPITSAEITGMLTQVTIERTPAEVQGETMALQLALSERFDELFLMACAGVIQNLREQAAAKNPTTNVAELTATTRTILEGLGN